jgi:hypothetical protein
MQHTKKSLIIFPLYLDHTSTTLAIHKASPDAENSYANNSYECDDSNHYASHPRRLPGDLALICILPTLPVTVALIPAAYTLPCITAIL